MPAAAPASELLLPTVWVLSDGKAGDEMQCLGVARRLGVEPEIRRVAPRKPFAWLMPRGPIDPREAPDRPESPIRPPFPDIVIASGRRAIPYVRAVKQASNGRTYTVILKDPRTGRAAADLIWVPAHDPLRGDNVLVTVTSPHGVSPERLAAAATSLPQGLAALPKPRVAVLVGGDSRHHRFTEADIARFASQLDALAMSGARLMGTASRRTPPALAAAVEAVFASHGGWWWDGTGDNPFLALLATADAVIVTADSVNMVGEAAATGRPILLFEPSGGHRKISAFVAALRRDGIVHDFRGRLEGEPYEPVDSTAVIAGAVMTGWLRHRTELALG